MAEIRWININMGCIETGRFTRNTDFSGKININMGCIETKELYEKRKKEIVDKH